MNSSAETLTEALAYAAQTWPHNKAMCANQRHWSWHALYITVERVAGYWHALGVKSGDTVGCLTDKSPEVVVAFLACARLGAVFCPINFKLNEKHICDQIATANVSVVLTQESRTDVLNAIAHSFKKDPLVLSIDTSTATGQHAFWPEVDYPQSDFVPTPDTVCYLNYTSGSTGRPKGAVSTHAHILINARDTIAGLDFHSEDVFLGMFSVFMHPHELFHRSILVGGAFVIVDSLSPRIISEQIAHWKVTWMMAVPSFYEMMIRYRETANHSPDLSSLRLLESGGAYVSAQTVKRMETCFQADFIPVWGCTEATGVVLANRSHRESGATGAVIPGYSAKIVDEDGKPLPMGVVGELIISGPAVVSEYIGQPEESHSAFQDGWYHTGDLMREIQPGVFQFASRRSEMLKVGGIRVFPLEIEQVIERHPEVSRCVVVGAVEKLRGEVPHAIVQRSLNSALDMATLIQFCAKHLARFKVPRKVSFWDEIPMLPNGKVDKRRLREMLG